nr:Rpn family recombination-promoting nuclease/putative transposase [Natranaerofaba carboxydovora]
MVYKAKIKDRDVIFYVLLELQSTVDFQMPYRLLLYMTEIWRDIIKNTDPQKAARKDFRLPVIVPIVLYNGENKWTVPLNFKEYLNGSELFGEHVLDFKYSLVNVRQYDENELLELENLLGTVFLLDQCKNFLEIIKALKKLAKIISKLNKVEFRLFVTWAKNILTRTLSPKQKEKVVEILDKANPEEVEEMISNVERVIKKTLADAKKEGKKEAEKESKRKIAKNMLKKGYKIEEIIEITNLSKEEIEEL